MTTLLPEFFRRLDERPDALFYRRQRGASHLDDAAKAFLRAAHDSLLLTDRPILDLMAGVSTHLGDAYPHVTGLGLNLSELHANPRIDEPVIFDINQNAELPFEPASFGGAICTVSVQYMTRPVATFASVARVLHAGAPFAVAISTRMYQEKAVLAWRASDDEAHERLVRSYFRESGAYGAVEVQRYAPLHGVPVTVLWARTHAPD